MLCTYWHIILAQGGGKVVRFVFSLRCNHFVCRKEGMDKEMVKVGQEMYNYSLQNYLQYFPLWVNQD